MPGVNYTVDLKTGGFNSGINQALGGISSLGSKLLGLASIAAAVAGAMAGITKALSLAADMESTTVAFETLLGSAEKTKKVLGELSKLEAQTPLEFPELADAARKLVAFGESGETVVNTLRRIGDISSGIQAPIGEIAEIYGKARVQGTLFAEDINQLTGRGIPVIQEFAKILGVTESEVKKLASEGKITFPMLERAFQNLTGKGGMFFEMLKKQSQTTRGLMSTLAGNINTLFRTVGDQLLKSFKPMLEQAVAVSDGLVKIFQAAIENGNLGEVVSNAITGGLSMSAAFLKSLVPYMAGLLHEALGEPFRRLKVLMQASLGTLMDGSSGNFWEQFLKYDEQSKQGPKFELDLSGINDQAKELLHAFQLARNGVAEVGTEGAASMTKVGEVLDATVKKLEDVKKANDAIADPLGGKGQGGEEGRRIRTFSKEESMRRRFDRNRGLQRRYGSFENWKRVEMDGDETGLGWMQGPRLETYDRRPLRSNFSFPNLDAKATSRLLQGASPGGQVLGPQGGKGVSATGADGVLGQVLAVLQKVDQNTRETAQQLANLQPA